MHTGRRADPGYPFQIGDHSDDQINVGITKKEKPMAKLIYPGERPVDYGRARTTPAARKVAEDRRIADYNRVHGHWTETPKPVAAEKEPEKKEPEKKEPAVIWPEPKPMPNGLPKVDAFEYEFLPDHLEPWA